MDTGGTPDDDAALGAQETGVSGVVDGVRYTITSANAYNIRASGFFGFNITDNNGPDGALRRWTMKAPLETGTHACAFSQADNTEISLLVGSIFYAASGDTGCTITVTSISPVLQATFSGNAAVFLDNRLQSVTISNGVVRLDEPD